MKLKDCLKNTVFPTKLHIECGTIRTECYVENLFQSKVMEGFQELEIDEMSVQNDTLVIIAFPWKGQNENGGN